MFRLLRGRYLKRMIARKSVRQGLLGGSLFWRLVWGYRTGRKAWSKVSKKGDAPVVFSEGLDEGEAWAVVHVPEKTKKGRGEGRRYGFGPPRPKPRVTTIAPAAITAAGRRILEVPDAARINEILGVVAVEEPEPTRRQKRKAKRAEKRESKAKAKAKAKA